MEFVFFSVTAKDFLLPCYLFFCFFSIHISERSHKTTILSRWRNDAELRFRTRTVTFNGQLLQLAQYQNSFLLKGRESYGHWSEKILILIWHALRILFLFPFFGKMGKLVGQPISKNCSRDNFLKKKFSPQRYSRIFKNCYTQNWERYTNGEFWSAHWFCFGNK